MHGFISPYELLCQSKPQQTPTFVTPYDLYSRAGQSGVHQAPPKTVASAMPSAPPEPVLSDRSPSFKHAHYISDIHARHSTAEKNAVFSSIPLK